MNLQTINSRYPDFTEYVDVKDGLGRTGNNKKLYVTFAEMFAKDLNFQKLCTMMENGDFSDAAAFAHAIKGVAGNLSFSKLYTLSAELEVKLKEGTVDAELFTNVKFAMNKTLFYLNLLSENIEDI